MERRKRRSFTPEFRAEAVRLVREGSKNLPQVAKDLDPRKVSKDSFRHLVPYESSDTLPGGQGGGRGADLVERHPA